MFLPVIRDEFFGKLAYDFNVSSYSTRKEIGGAEATVLVDPSFAVLAKRVFQTQMDFLEWADKNRELCDKAIKSSLKTAAEVFSWARENEKKLRETVAEKMLSTYNDSWNEGKKISKAEFASKIKIDSLNIAENGKFEVFYNDGELFSGHFISIKLDSNKKVKSVDLAG